jgi:hypothetical protein
VRLVVTLQNLKQQDCGAASKLTNKEKALKTGMHGDNPCRQPTQHLTNLDCLLLLLAERKSLI